MANLFSLLAFFLACNALVPACSQLLPIVGGNGSQIQTYVVHVYPPEDIELLGAEQLEEWHKSFLPNTTLDSGEPRLVYSYHRVISGFAARLTADEVEVMEKMEGFVSAQPEQHRRLGTTYTPQFLGLDQYNSLWEKSRLGEGVIIGVLDSGIVPTHPSFDDEGMPEPPLKWRGCCEFSNTRCNKWVPKPCNNKLIGAVSFRSGRTPEDEIGHGTHVAGIAAGKFVHGADVLDQAKGTAAGVAPRAHLAVYKVCLTLKDCSDPDILAGIEKAMDDGVDVLSMSIEEPGEQIFSSAIARGTFRAMEEGIISVCCAGNGGPKPSSVSNDAPWILSVGASSIDRVARATVRLGDGMELDGESSYQPENFDSSTMMPIAYPGTIDTDVRLACQPGAFNGMKITGKIVLCGKARNDPVNKGELVKAAGGAAVIVLNQVWNGYTIEAEPHVIPAANLNHQDSLKVVKYFLTEPNPTATIIFKDTLYGARRAPAVASFSSRGPSLVNGGILKPDIIGPGVDILSAWHEEVGPKRSGRTDKLFNFEYGCSMATPHLAGVAALLKSSHPDWSPAAIKSAIMTTAHTLDRQGKPIADEASPNMDPASVFAMGAGHVDPSKADDPGLIYDIKPEEYIGYLCGGLKYTPRQVFMVVGRPIQCSAVKNVEADQLNLPSISVNLGTSALNRPGSGTCTKATVSRTVTNVGEANSVFSVEVVEPRGVTVKVTPQLLQFSSLDEEKSYTVEISTDGKPPAGEYSEGQLRWISNKHSVRSPISVTF